TAGHRPWAAPDHGGVRRHRHSGSTRRLHAQRGDSPRGSRGAPGGHLRPGRRGADPGHRPAEPRPVTSRRWSFPTWCAVLLVLVLLAPPVRHRVEATMSAQMLLQIPLLIAAGWLLSRAMSAGALARVGRWNHGGIAGLVLVAVVSTFWMLPRSLD